MKRRTAVIVILYQALVSECYLKLSEDCSIVLIVVDNTPGRDLDFADVNLLYIPLRENRGIAYAQNAGIREAMKRRCEHVVFFDQDSELPDGYIGAIVDEYQRIETLIPNLFVLGPALRNGRTQEEYRSTVHKDRWLGEDFVWRETVISSGCCVAVAKIGEVGLNDESLFIDCVDHEWCWRAAGKGFVNGITPRIMLTHYIGQQEYKLFNQLVIIWSPIRYYYQMRNYLLLLGRSYVPLRWKINNGIKWIVYPLTYPFKVKHWRAIYGQMLRGLKDGIFKRKRIKCQIN